MGYPVLLYLEGRQVVIVGGGQVATRKIGDLMDSGANVLVISPVLNNALKTLVERGLIGWREECYTPGTLQTLRPFLVFAASDSPEVNTQVVSEAQALGLLVGRADGEGDFASMAAVRRGPLTLAIATEGASPALAAHLRQRLETIIGDEYVTLAGWLAELRPLVRKHVKSSDERRVLWQAMVESPALEYLRRNDEISARRVIHHLLIEAGVEAINR